MAPNRLRRESSADQVAAHIRRTILAGELRRGERLRQDDIADELGISRIPVREAIIALDREGWVRFESNRGAYVSGLAADDIRDHYELRGLVLGLIAKRAAAAAGADDVERLRKAVRSLREAVDVEEFSQRNDRLLAALLALAASPRLTAALLVTPSIIPTGFFDVVPKGRMIQTDGMVKVVRAIASHDEARADAAMRAVLGRQGGAVVEAFAAKGLLDA